MPDPLPLIRELPVMGLFYRDSPTKILVRDATGRCEVAFRPEPENPHDAHACMVFLNIEAEWRHVGYIPRTVSGLFLRMFTDPANFQATALIRPGKSLPEILISVDLLQ